MPAAGYASYSSEKEIQHFDHMDIPVLQSEILMYVFGSLKKKFTWLHSNEMSQIFALTSRELSTDPRSGAWYTAPPII